MRKKLILGAIFGVLCVSPAVAQVKEIGRAEFIEPRKTALSSFYASNYRQQVNNEYYEDGILVSSEEWTYETVKPDRKRHLEIIRKGEQITKFESITVGTVTYCRKDDGEWQLKAGSCGTGGGSGGPSDIISDKFTKERIKENGRKLTLYEEYTVYKNTYGPEKDRSRSRFWQTRYWIDDKGKLVREEQRRGLIGPEQISNRLLTLYEYDPPGLKIEAPVVVSP